MKKRLLIVLVILTSQLLFSQKWVEMAYTPGISFYDVQTEFYKYFKDKDLTEKSTGYKAFKRWEYFVEPRVYPSGDITLLSRVSENYQAFLKEYKQIQATAKEYSGSSINSGTWVPVGPFGAPAGSLGVPTGGGRDNFITFQPGVNATFYAGSAGGSLWKTTNGGTSWSSISEEIPTGGRSDLLIDPNNVNIMYVASGSGDDQLSGNPIVSDGVYKSIDGGLTWAATGFTFNVSANRFIHKLVFDPNNSQIIFVASSTGIYRTIDAGATWTPVASFNCWDLKFHPTNSSILYAAGTAFHRSTDAGLTFTIVNAGIPTGGANRMAIAVTPINPSNVYVLASRSSDSQFMGLYRSTNDGANFVTASTSPNVIGNSCGGGSTGKGQGWYDLAIAASPITPNEIVVGGVNVWRSSNGGNTWSMIGCWINTPWVHADIHELEYRANGTLFAASDGGTFEYTGSGWNSLFGQRNTAQIYKIGLSGLTPNRWITGHQDNGSSINTGGTYTYRIGGDGMDCFIDRTDDLKVWGSTQNGGLRRSTNGGISWNGATSGLPTGGGPWLTAYKQDPVNAGLIYCGFSQLYKSLNGGVTWTQVGNTGGGGDISEFAIAPSNNQVIYVCYNGIIRKTTNGGVTWGNATPNSLGGKITFITIDPSDENTAWVTVSGYTAGNKVLQTLDGGTTWMNISSNLPNLPANCSVYEPGTNDRIYIGMDVGVYTKDNSSTNWTLYNTDLPNVVVSDLEMTPAMPGKIFAATYGRGVYMADAIQVSAPPVAGFTVYGGACSGKTNIFYDNSSNNPTSWSWSVLPAAGVIVMTGTVNNPGISFPSPGIYTISLVSGNNFGMSSMYTQTVMVNVSPVLAITPANPTVCMQEPFTLVASGANSYTWSNAGGNSDSATFTAPVFNWNYTVTGANGSCVEKLTVEVSVMNCVGIKEINSEAMILKVYPNPAKDILHISFDLETDLEIMITDVSGKIIKVQKVNFDANKHECQLNIGYLKPGVYFLTTNNSGFEKQSIKFIVE